MMDYDTTSHRISVMQRCTSDVCNQGREACPTPTACEVPGEEMKTAADAIFTAAVYGVVGIVTVGFLIAFARAVWPVLAAVWHRNLI
jgi:hypothetical protein